MRYFLDTEFNGFGGQLISLALVPVIMNDPGLYLVTECEEAPEPWVAENVIPILWKDVPDGDRVERDEFGRFIASYLHRDPDPIIVADWPDDIRYFCQALITAPGEMVNIPGIKFEMHRVDAYPTTLEGAVQHNAWWDAMALRQLFVATAP